MVRTPPRPSTRAALIVLGCGGFIALLIVEFMPAGAGRTQDGRPVLAAPHYDHLPAPSTRPPVVFDPPAGGGAVLELPGGSGVWLATTDADWGDLLDAENDGAKGGPGAGAAIYRMAAEGRARKYPNGTPVRVLKSRLFSRFVVIAEGEDLGRSGWVQAEFVKSRR